jgi:hypothetical protein
MCISVLPAICSELQEQTSVSLERIGIVMVMTGTPDLQCLSTVITTADWRAGHHTRRGDRKLHGLCVAWPTFNGLSLSTCGWTDCDESWPRGRPCKVTRWHSRRMYRSWIKIPFFLFNVAVKVALFQIKVCLCTSNHNSDPWFGLGHCPVFTISDTL